MGSEGSRGPHEHRALIDFLELTPEQEESWTALHEEFRQTMHTLMGQQRTLSENLRALLESDDPDPREVGSLVLAQQDYRQQLESGRADLEVQLVQILNDEQLVRYQAFRAASEILRGGGGRSGRGGPHSRRGRG